MLGREVLWLGNTRSTVTLLLAIMLFLSLVPFLTGQAAAANTANAVVNPGFEDPSSTAWFSYAYANGTVTIYDTSHPHSGVHSTMLNATKTVLTCPGGCKDAVGAKVQEYLPASSPTLNNLAATPDSFSAWWYVADPSTTGMPAYSLHIQLMFSDQTSIEYFYGTSDLTDQRYNLGPIPATKSWFQMTRNLSQDIQGVVSNPSNTRISELSFSAFGNITDGEIGWVDDAAINFNSGPVAVFSSSPAGGSAPLTVTFDASQSYEIAGSSSSISSYQWSFGDGSSSPDGPLTTHTFSNAGTFQVSLTLTDANGFSSTSSSTVTVGQPDVTIPLLLGVGTGALLLGGLVFGLFRRRRSSPEKAKPRFRKR